MDGFKTGEFVDDLGKEYHKQKGLVQKLKEKISKYKKIGASSIAAIIIGAAGLISNAPGCDNKQDKQPVVQEETPTASTQAQTPTPEVPIYRHESKQLGLSYETIEIHAQVRGLMQEYASIKNDTLSDAAKFYMATRISQGDGEVSQSDLETYINKQDWRKNVKPEDGITTDVFNYKTPEFRYESQDSKNKMDTLIAEHVSRVDAKNGLARDNYFRDQLALDFNAKRDTQNGTEIVYITDEIIQKYEQLLQEDTK